MEREEILPTDDDDAGAVADAGTGAGAGGSALSPQAAPPGAQDNAYDRPSPTDSAALSSTAPSTLLPPPPPPLRPPSSSAAYRTIGGNTGDAVVLVQRWYRADRSLGPRVEVALQVRLYSPYIAPI